MSIRSINISGLFRQRPKKKSSSALDSGETGQPSADDRANDLPDCSADSPPDYLLPPDRDSSASAGDVVGSVIITGNGNRVTIDSIRVPNIGSRQPAPEHSQATSQGQMPGEFYYEASKRIGRLAATLIEIYEDTEKRQLLSKPQWLAQCIDHLRTAQANAEQLDFRARLKNNQSSQESLWTFLKQASGAAQRMHQSEENSELNRFLKELRSYVLEIRGSTQI